MDVKERALQAHEKWGGKIEVVARCEVNSKDDLSIAYTPGVAEPCLKIKDDPSLSYTYTRRHNLVAVITDGTAVLGLGDIGPIAGMPVMEGKCALFKAFADVDAFPLCVASKDVDEIVRTIQLISGSFGGINLEDIAAPRCFEIERRLKEVCDIPVFHDDQHGTAVCCGAALLNACRLTGRKVDEIKMVVNGCRRSCHCRYQVPDVPRRQAHYDGRALRHRLRGGRAPESGTAGDGQGHQPRAHDRHAGRCCQGCGCILRHVRSAGAYCRRWSPPWQRTRWYSLWQIRCPRSGRRTQRRAALPLSAPAVRTIPNQINNVLAFPGIFRGALDVRASDINEEMKLAAAKAIAACVSDEELNAEYIMPMAFDKKVIRSVADAVAQAARDSGVARI